MAGGIAAFFFIFSDAQGQAGLLCSSPSLPSSPACALLCPASSSMLRSSLGLPDVAIGLVTLRPLLTPRDRLHRRRPLLARATVVGAQELDTTVDNDPYYIEGAYYYVQADDDQE
ncbi:uncharacterized protein [Triticum aestivum]|uniref:uncharacterized protein n=1 Tax=Triticum aestivum TaxID=4565 RepID=UPI001D001D81|nr:uncharacterized protein LOC123087069 [Triticum aestivum]